MFFKKLSFGRRRAMPQMNDDMNASIFPRTDHAVQLGQKAFNMSQPTLGMHISSSMGMDSEDRSDVSHTESSSPASSSQIHQRHVEFASKPLLSSAHPPALVPGAEGMSRRPMASGLPPIPEPATKAVDGLPPSSSPPVPLSLIPGGASPRQGASNTPLKPYLQQSHSAQSVPNSVSDSASTVSC